MAYKVPAERYTYNDRGYYTVSVSSTSFIGPSGIGQWVYSSSAGTPGSLQTDLRNYTRMTVPNDGLLKSITFSASFNGTWSASSPNNLLIQVYRYAASDIASAAWNSTITPTKIGEVSVPDTFEDKVYCDTTELTSGNAVTKGDQLAWYLNASNASNSITANAYFNIALNFELE
jgi:hypothetical protein